MEFFIYLVSLEFSMQNSQKIGRKKVFLNIKNRDAFLAFYLA